FDFFNLGVSDNIRTLQDNSSSGRTWKSMGLVDVWRNRLSDTGVYCALRMARFCNMVYRPNSRDRDSDPGYCSAIIAIYCELSADRKRNSRALRILVSLN